MEEQKQPAKIPAMWEIRQFEEKWLQQRSYVATPHEIRMAIKEHFGYDPLNKDIQV